MEKLLGMIKKELKEIEEKGLSSSNIEMAGKLADMYKDLTKGKYYEEEGGQDMIEYGRYREGGVYREGYRDRYNDDGYGAGGYYPEYGRRGVPGSGRGRYRGSRMHEHVERLREGADEYEYGRERYMHSGDETRVAEGLEKLMYGVCMMVETAMDYAETPHEKEIIRKHVQKIKNI